MAHDAWYCLDCAQERDLDSRALCTSCGSGSLTPASLVKPRLTTEKQGSGISWNDGRRDRHGFTSRPAQSEPRLGPLTAAAVFVDGEDLHRIQASLAPDGVEVVKTAGLDEAIRTLVPVILLDADRHHAWAITLRTAVKMRPEARVIVLAHHADEHMWTDVRSLGAHDLLPKPFHASEARSVVLGAFQGKSQVVWKGRLHLVLHVPSMQRQGER